jgi:hypothetical protein
VEKLSFNNGYWMMVRCSDRNCICLRFVDLSYTPKVVTRTMTCLSERNESLPRRRCSCLLNSEIHSDPHRETCWEPHFSFPFRKRFLLGGPSGILCTSDKEERNDFRI